jgi:LAS superfamily LD-carboxypeptidase LdcB
MSFPYATVLSILAIALSPCSEVRDSGTLWLVNRENTLAEDFRPQDLVRFQGAELREPVRDAFIEMLAEIESEGIFGLKLQSAYRAHSYQNAIFEQRVRELCAEGHSPQEARELTARSIQYAGASEHQLGLALDVSINGKLSQAFSETEAGRWLEENCHRFGFIIRYPKAKAEVTDIIYEPWHLRYAGIPHAQIMYEESLTLEEYHEFLAQIPMYLVWGEDCCFLTMYCDFPPEDTPEIFNASATEQGETAGYIVTVKRAISSQSPSFENRIREGTRG